MCGGAVSGIVSLAGTNRGGPSPRVRGSRSGCTNSRRPAIRVHPRVCGGAMALARFSAAWGHGSIPACAGEPAKQTVPARTCGRSAVHPRVCGGSLPGRHRGRRRSKKRSIPACAGEPRPTADGQDGHSAGSIPACAGEPDPSDSRRSLQPNQVHPRVCGGAGIQPITDNHIDNKGVHPRVCGGSRYIAVESLVAGHGSGPSPRVRGSHRSSTVAHAARSRGPSPRVRGSRLPDLDGFLSLRPDGSIPACARGAANAEAHVTVGCTQGPSPACAGEPLGCEALMATARPTVHPRVCGGAALCAEHLGSQRQAGVHPRVCGGATWDWAARRPRHPGSIPACAGEPSPRWWAPCRSDSGSIPACAGEPSASDGRTSGPSGVHPRVCGGAA